MKLHELVEQVENLKMMPRTGWLLCNVHLKEVEDVAQHSFDVAVITFLLSGELERQGVKLNAERTMGMAIIHDWAEAIVGDFPYPAVKHLGSRERKNEMERKALKEMLQELPKGAEYLRLWDEYTEKRSPEAKLVHAADYLSMLLQAIKYRERGNRSRELDVLWNAVKRDLSPYEKCFKPVKELVRELEKRHLDLKKAGYS
jgi:putative hydrolase of HD superfamily